MLIFYNQNIYLFLDFGEIVHAYMDLSSKLIYLKNTSQEYSIYFNLNIYYSPV